MVGAMSKFVDLGVSVFDDDFTLNPYDYLQGLYDRDEVLGFHADNMNFLFRFEQSRQVMFNRDCVRAMGNNEELADLEARYAELYPNRAWYFNNAYMHGDPDLKFKAAVGRVVADIAEQADFSQAEQVFAQLAGGGTLENYIDEVATLPLRIFLNTCRLPYNESEIPELHAGGCAFLKALENFYDEELIADCERGITRLRQYMSERYDDLPPESPLQHMVSAGRASGMSDDQVLANITGNFLTSISNTVGISSAFILRSLLRERNALEWLKSNPELARNEHTIMELLRRDNHVKALTRQFNAPMQLGDFAIDQGEVLCLYFPGIAMDQNHWPQPDKLDFSRRFSGENNIIFGGSFYTCIGRKLTMAFMGEMIDGFLRYLPSQARVDDAEIEVDGSWMAERILTRMPIHLDG